MLKEAFAVVSGSNADCQEHEEQEQNDLE